MLFLLLNPPETMFLLPLEIRFWDTIEENRYITYLWLVDVDTSYARD